MSELREMLILVGAVCRVAAFIVGLMALRHAIMKGMYIEAIPMKIRFVLYGCGAGLLLSAMAGIMRVADVPLSPEIREVTHIGVSLSIIMVGVLVMMCPVNKFSIYSLRSMGMESAIRTKGGLTGSPATSVS